MTQSLHLFSRRAIYLLVFVLLSSLSSYLQAQNRSVTTTQSFSYAGQIVTWTMPTDVTSLTIKAWVAKGRDVHLSSYRWHRDHHSCSDKRHARPTIEYSGRSATEWKRRGARSSWGRAAARLIPIQL
ncbi:hypothetical protein [Spirosoma agri]|uniref:Uncharacterized protein n=1 Tax=Spirosoma agri TaxID=1987381 RepID=A0A6M0IFK8_9BACT|nr:hypothetical protein [Spirosoma agri]NEU66934.1 hypothetical protein [Spirosoma agri]